jgi:protocatechuate 3,4-dioxygenase beta subunit
MVTSAGPDRVSKDARISAWLRCFVTAAVVALAMVSPGVGSYRSAAAQSDGVTFRETGKTVRGPFLRYLSSNGSTPRFGYPISDEMQERSETDGKTYTVQYFERAVFEAHPENQIPYDVLLSLLGVLEYKAKYPNGAPGQLVSNTPDARSFPETGKHLSCQFLAYWQANGGLPHFGYPISDELIERDALGRAIRVQYFQRAVLKYDAEAIATFDSERGYVVPTSMGTDRFRARYAAQAATLPTLQPTAVPSGGCVPTPHGSSYSDEYPTPPLRASVGTGLVITGTVRSSGSGCAPLANAEVLYVVAGPDGEYDADHEGKVLTRANGTYRFTTNFPGFYGAGGPHVHIYVLADGYRSQELEVFVACGQTEGRFDVVLAPDTVRSTPTVQPTEPPASSQACTPTYEDPASPTYVSGAPVRSVVGKGHVLTGTVRSSADCASISGAKLELWPEDPAGGHPDRFRATLYTDAAGAYRFECNPTDHIHMRISAPGYHGIFTNAYHTQGRTEGTFDIVLAPER